MWLGNKMRLRRGLRENVFFSHYLLIETLKVWGFTDVSGEYPEKAMAPHSSTLAWKIPWMEEPGGLQSMGSLESDTTERLHFDFSLSCIGEGNGNPLQCSCLENPRDGGAWWAAVSGVAQSRTRLKRLRSSSSSRRVSVKLGRRKLIRNSKRDDKWIWLV